MSERHLSCPNVLHLATAPCDVSGSVPLVLSLVGPGCTGLETGPLIPPPSSFLPPPQPAPQGEQQRRGGPGPPPRPPRQR